MSHPRSLRHVSHSPPSEVGFKPHPWQAARIGSVHRRPLAGSDSALECAADVAGAAIGDTPNLTVECRSSTQAEQPTVVEALTKAAAVDAMWHRVSWSCLQHARSVHKAIYMMVASAAIGCTPSLHSLLSERGALSWLGNAVHSLGQCGVVLGSSVLGAGLWNAWKVERASRCSVARNRLRGATSEVCTSIEALDGARGDQDARDDAVFVATACSLRLVVLPALCLPMHLAMAAVGFLPADPTLLMILTVSAGTPSAQTLVMVLNANGATSIAEEASKVYLPLYLLSVLSVALLIFVVCLAVGEPGGTSPDLRS